MHAEKPKWNALALFFIFLAVSTTVFGTYVNENHTFLVANDSPAKALIYTLLIIAYLTAAVYFAGRLLRVDVGLRCDALRDRRVNLTAFFIAVMCINTLYLLAYYPGTNNYDTLMQVNDFFDGTRRTRYVEGGGVMITAFLNDHHPIVTTLLFSMFVKFGRAINNERLGYFLYSFVQIGLYAYVYTEIVRYYQEKGSVYRWFAAAFFLLNPFLPYFTIMMLKDSLYTVLFLLYFLRFIQLYRSDKNPGWRRVTAFILLSVFIPLTKKTGVYVVALSNAVLLLHMILARRRDILPIAASLLLPVVVTFVIFPHIIFPAFDIYPGGKQEVIATLLQQSARVGIDHEDAYTEEEKAVLNKIFRFSGAAEHYKYFLSDPIKNTYKLRSVTDEDLKAYYKLWFKTGLKYPVDYLEATAGICGGFFAPTAHLSVYRTNHLLEITTAPVLSAIRGGIESIYDFMMNMPGLNLLFQIVLYTWWIPLFATYRMIRRGGWRSLGLMLPLYVSILILIVCPRAYSRYALPLVIICPLVLIESKYGLKPAE